MQKNNNNKPRERDTLKKPLEKTSSGSTLKGEVATATRVLQATEPGTSGSRGPVVEGGNPNPMGRATSTAGSVNAALVSKPRTTGKVIPAQKRRYRERRAALRIMEKLAATPEGQLTTEQKGSLAWAKGTLSGDNSRREPAVSKRQRSQDELEAGESKRPKMQGASGNSRTHGEKLFSEVLKEHPVMLAVIDRGQEDGSITLEKWRLVYNALNSVFLTVLRENPGPPPSCRDAGWHQGRAKLTACLDQRSVDLYRLAMAKVGEVWPGAKLAVVGREEIPSRPRARAWLPSEPSRPEDILDIIRASNMDLPTGNWKVIKQEEAKEGSRLTTLVVNKESLASLAKTKGVIGFGFGSITLKVFKKDGVEAEAEDRPVEIGGESSITRDKESSVMERLAAMGSRLSLDSEDEDRVGSVGQGGDSEASMEDPKGEAVTSAPLPRGSDD